MQIKQQGFSLLELMIAILILAIGLLGMAAMQSVALSSNQEAQIRVQALAIAEDLSSRMRANRKYVNLSMDKYPLMSADTEYNLYSTSNYNNAEQIPAFVLSATECDDPNTAVDETSFRERINCRATADITDIRRQMNPDTTTGRLLPAGSLLYVDCADKSNPTYAIANDADACSPGSVYTIYVIWPISNANVEAGQIQNANQLNARCRNKLAAESNPIAQANAGCVIMDIVP